MKKLPAHIIFGLLLIAGGVLFLVDSLGILPLHKFWPILLGIPALVLLYVFVVDRHKWWAAIPGSAFLGLTAMLIYEQFAKETPGDIEATLFMGTLGLGFLAIYLRTGFREWWAIIPGGVLLTIGTLVGIETWVREEISGSIFMLGLGLTFGAVYLAPARGHRNRWAAIPSGILITIGLIGILSNTQLLGIIGALALISLGGYLLLRAARTRRR